MHTKIATPKERQVTSSERIAGWKNVLKAAGDLSNDMTPRELKHHKHDDYQDAFKETLSNFEEDFQKAYTLLLELTALPEASDAEGVAAYTEQFATRLNQLQLDYMPSIPAIRAAYYDMKDINPPQPGQKQSPHILASFASSILASIPNPNPYHGNGHFREIPLIGIILTEAEMKYDNYKYSAAVIATILASHDLHDFAHTGRNNKVHGQFIPCFLEKRSLEGTRPYLVHAGLDDIDIATNEVAILGTEAAQDPAIKETCGKPRSQLVGDCYRYWFENDGTLPMPVVPDDLKLLLDETMCPDAIFADSSKSGIHRQFLTIGARATRIAENMRIADIFASLMNFESFVMRYDQLHVEFPDMYPKSHSEITREDWKGFIKYVLGGTTDAQGNFQPVVPSIGARVLIKHVLEKEFPKPALVFATPRVTPGPQDAPTPGM